MIVDDEVVQFTDLLQTASSVGAFYTAHRDELHLDQIIIRAPRRSPSSESPTRQEYPSADWNNRLRVFDPTQVVVGKKDRNQQTSSGVQFASDNDTASLTGETHSGTLDLGTRTFREYKPRAQENDGSTRGGSSSQDATPAPSLVGPYNGQFDGVPLHPPPPMPAHFSFTHYSSPFGYGQRPPGWGDHSLMRPASALPFHQASGSVAQERGYGHSAPATPAPPPHPASGSAPPPLQPSFMPPLSQDGAYGYPGRPMMAPPPNMHIPWLGQHPHFSTLSPTMGHMYPPPGPPQHFDYSQLGAMHSTMPPRPPTSTSLSGSRWNDEDGRGFG